VEGTGPAFVAMESATEFKRAGFRTANAFILTSPKGFTFCNAAISKELKHPTCLLQVYVT